jgi:quercetin dioxygenase-like cupin family protein
MKTRFVVNVVCYVIVPVVAFGLGAAIGQQAPPKENKGVVSERTGTLDLAEEIQGLQGWQLRLRTIRGEPGAVFGIHSHKDRPAIAFVMQGTLTEYREGGYVKEHREGDTLIEGKDTTHWAENKGKTPIMLVVADILKAK